MYHKKLRWPLIALLIVALTGCATVQLKPEEQARVAVSFFQDEIKIWKDGAKEWALGLPQETEEELRYKHEIITAFNDKVMPAYFVAVRTIRDVAEEMDKGNLSYETALTIIRPFVSRVIGLISELG